MFAGPCYGSFLVFFPAMLWGFGFVGDLYTFGLTMTGIVSEVCCFAGDSQPNPR